MKFMHLSDLHIGKKVNEFSMIEDQKHILEEILKIVDSTEVEAVFIAGDLYDKPVPPNDAVQLVDDFLTKLSERNIKVFVISGNHDSPERVSFGSELMKQSGIYMSPVFEGGINPITLEDRFGPVHIYMLPFIKPAHVRRYFEEVEIDSYNTAVKTVMDSLTINESERNILMTHQFITGGETSESEELSVGGSDNVDASNFDAFDYVALGHLHKAQRITRDEVRYAGTPLKYSFSETNHKKSVTIVELSEKGDVKFELIPLVPLRDMREIKGVYSEITRLENYKSTNIEDYIRVTLTDEEDIPDVIGKLRAIYPNIMKIDYDNTRTRSNQQLESIEDIETKSPLVLFEEFYQSRNNQEMSEDQRNFTSELIEEIWGAK